MRRLLVSIVCCVLLGAGPGAIVVAAQSDLASELIQRVNDFRAANGALPLEVNSALMLAAQRHAEWQAVNRIHSHQGEGGTMPQDRATAAGYQGLAAENVASGTRGYVTPAWAVEGWAGSYGHRVTMLAPETHIGVGVAENDEETFFVLMVGSPSPLVPQTMSDEGEIPGDNTEQPLPAAVVPILLATPREDGSIVHVVQTGQTAWVIAARYGISLDELRALNQLGPNAVLHPGDEVIIRLGEGQQPLPSPTLPVTHPVQTGDTLWSIAVQYGLTLDNLLALNGLTRGAIIKPGDEVRIRAAEQPTLAVSPAPTQILPEAVVPTPSMINSLTPVRTATLLPSPTIVPSPTMTPISVPVPRTGDKSESTDQGVLVGVSALVVMGLLMILAGAVVIIRRE